jgi:hypothetical protein
VSVVSSCELYFLNIFFSHILKVFILLLWVFFTYSQNVYYSIEKF